MYKLLSGLYTDDTNIAFEDLLQRNRKLPKLVNIKLRKNHTKRLTLPKVLKEQISKRSGDICEELSCYNPAKPRHHLLSVFQYPDLQFDINNIIHICISCHRKRHLELPDSLFNS